MDTYKEGLVVPRAEGLLQRAFSYGVLLGMGFVFLTSVVHDFHQLYERSRLGRCHCSLDTPALQPGEFHEASRTLGFWEG